MKAALRALPILVLALVFGLSLAESKQPGIEVMSSIEEIVEATPHEDPPGMPDSDSETNVDVNPDAPAPTIILADRILDVVSGMYIENGYVVVQGDKIIEVHRRSALSSSESELLSDYPEGTELIDLGDHTLMPGWMDMHVHLTSELGNPQVPSSTRSLPQESTLFGAVNAEKTLMAGFTTVRYVGSTDFNDVALMRAIDRGWFAGPRIIPAGYSLGITGGHCDSTGFAPGLLERGWREGVADGPDEVLKAVRYQIKHGAKVIKFCATAGVLSFEGPVGAQQFTFEEMKTIIEEAERHGIPTAAHAHGTEGIIAAAKAGVSSIEHGSILDEEAIRVLKQYGTYLVPTTYLADAVDFSGLPPVIAQKAEFVIPLAKDSLRRAIASGVKIAFGTDAGVYPHGDNAKEFTTLVRDRGMDALEAIRAATINAADLARLDDRGVIEVGRFADLVAVPGDPIANIELMEQVAFIMKGGVIYKQPSE